jgi:hypothetical protein
VRRSDFLFLLSLILLPFLGLWFFRLFECPHFWKIQLYFTNCTLDIVFERRVLYSISSLFSYFQDFSLNFVRLISGSHQ